MATDRRHIELDIRTRPLGRRWPSPSPAPRRRHRGGLLTDSAFDPRYASVIFIPLILLVALGWVTFPDRRVRVGILAVAVVAGLASSMPNITTNRTQAGPVAAAIAALGSPETSSPTARTSWDRR